VLEIRGAGKSYGPRVALTDVSLSVRRGEILALLGPNGAGKTTLVRAVCGRIALDAGSVRIAGGDPRTDARVRRRFGIVPQEIALYPELTARENLEILGRLAGVPRRGVAEAVRHALEWADLAGRADDRVGTLSGGMKRRLNIVAGALHAPDLLVLDEPTVGVDPAAREALHRVLGSFRARGLALLLTTHDLDQAAELADRVVILVEGRVRAMGSPAGLVQDTFGGAKELRITLSADPDAAGRARLQAEGLESAGAPTRWSGRLAAGLENVSSLGERLTAGGLEIAELRVREPGLRGVFFRVTGRELEE
jgi:ABC-2 type transport system ATP-binding protein